MATYTINSKIHGKQEFTVNGIGGYVRLNGKQICRGGKFTGSTITCADDCLGKVARNWWRSYLKNNRNI